MIEQEGWKKIQMIIKQCWWDDGDVKIKKDKKISLKNDNKMMWWIIYNKVLTYIQNLS